MNTHSTRHTPKALKHVRMNALELGGEMNRQQQLSESARACACVCEALSLARRAERVLSALSLSTHRVRFSFAHSFCWFASLFWLLLLAGCLCRRCCRRCCCRVCRGSSTGKRCCRRRRRCSLPSLCAAVARLAIQLSLVESQSKHNQLRFGGTFVRWQRFG